MKLNSISYFFNEPAKERCLTNNYFDLSHKVVVNYPQLPPIIQKKRFILFPVFISRGANSYLPAPVPRAHARRVPRLRRAGHRRRLLRRPCRATDQCSSEASCSTLIELPQASYTLAAVVARSRYAAVAQEVLNDNVGRR
jgi:hypothetical protein